MSVQQQIDRIENNISDTYTVLGEAGAIMPASQNSQNLANTAASISAVLYNKDQNLSEVQQAQARKNINAVEQIIGKGLSTNDYTTEEKNKLNDLKNSSNKFFKITALANSWVGTKPPFKQTIRVSNMISDGTVIYDLQQFNEEQTQGYDNIIKLITRMNSVELWSLEKPTVDLDLRLDIIGSTMAELSPAEDAVLDVRRVKPNWQNLTGNFIIEPTLSSDGEDYSVAQNGKVKGKIEGQNIAISGDKGIFASTSLVSMFSSNKFQNIDLKYLDTSKVTNMTSMFYNCDSLTSLDLSNFDTSNVSNMNYMFDGCSSLTSLDLSNFNTSKVTFMSQMFCWCKDLTSLNLSSFDTSKVTDMSYMFGSCSSLTSLNISQFDTSNVSNISYMFGSCSSLTSLNLSSFDTSNVTDMSYMFNGCFSLTSLDLSSFDTSNVSNISYMFNDCSSLTSLNLSSFDTFKVTDMRFMFSGCSSLTSLDLSSFDTSKVTDMSYMFNRSDSLTLLDLSNFNTSNVTNMSYMFNGCSPSCKVYCRTQEDKDKFVASTNNPIPAENFIVGKPTV